MFNRFALPIFAAVAAIAAAANPSSALAQLPFSVTVYDSVLTLSGEQVIELKAKITNESFVPIEVRAVRLVNELPDTSVWSTAMCFGDLCYPADMNETPKASIPVGGSVLFKLTVAAFTSEYESGRVRAAIRFDTGPVTDGVEQEFIVNIDGTSWVDGDTRAAINVARPNPARSMTTLPFDAPTIASTADVMLLNALGRVALTLHDVALTDDGVRVDVSSVPNGAYIYRVIADGKASTGRVIVSR